MKTLTLKGIRTECKLLIRRDAAEWHIRLPDRKSLIIPRRGNLRDSLDEEAFSHILKGNYGERYYLILLLRDKLHKRVSV